MPMVFLQLPYLFPKNAKLLLGRHGFESQESDIDFPADDETSGYVEIKLTPHIKLTLEGLVLSGKDLKPVDAQFNVYRFSDFIKEDSKMIREGKYSEALTHFGWYMFDFSAPGYMDVTDTVWVLNCKRKSVHKNYYLSPIETGLTMKLNEIHFNFGKAVITEDSYAELDQMVEFIKKNPSMQIEVAGHTDSEGPDDFNLFLSQARAQAVARYISNKGIDPEHLIAKGYGETKPIESNATEAGKSKNRRVELVVIKK